MVFSDMTKLIVPLTTGIIRSVGPLYIRGLHPSDSSRKKAGATIYPLGCLHRDRMLLLDFRQTVLIDSSLAR